MASNYYKPCAELDECDRLIEEYFLKGQYAECFKGHLRLAKKEYPLAECQTGYFYHEGLGVEKDMKKSFFYTERAARHGDRDAQFNLANWFYEPGVIVEKNMAEAIAWYRRAARQGQSNAVEYRNARGIDYDDITPEK